MDKIYAVARGLAILLAIVAAFVALPQVAPALLILGAISAVGSTSETNAATFLVTIVLILGAKSLDAIPMIGPYLATIFGGLGTALIGNSMLRVALGVVSRVKGDWMQPAQVLAPSPI